MRDDLVEGIKRTVGGAAVQRTGECAECSAQRCVDVGTGGRDHSRSEGRGVEPVVHRQDQVLLDGPRVRGRRYLPGDHEEPVRGDAEVGAWGNRGLAGSHAVQRGEQRGGERRRAQRIGATRLVVGIPQWRNAHCGPECRHDGTQTDQQLPLAAEYRRRLEDAHDLVRDRL